MTIEAMKPALLSSPPPTAEQCVIGISDVLTAWNKTDVCSAFCANLIIIQIYEFWVVAPSSK
jgi:hypothetical protein